ncbi:ferritin-like metal-binding protein YciE [Variovorax boronicumulans]|uniref:Ferritin-like metal-binding protein YciE n=2 Tax=Variovorax boronicumulans TaxID=436515 RepID=A0AAW8D4C9_9BURK|nr:ferritin-like metal-binding protein YciE [Variovorax boronicumulans]MDQ0055374.1 ferritin-like metal-binding protein YciE [Variovorax boronicumulans]
MPPELREELEKSAAANSRSLNAEVVSRLQASIDGSTGLQLPAETLERLRKAAKKSGRTLESELFDRMITSLADLPPAEQRLREQLEKERQENAALRLEAEQHRLDTYKRSTMLYVILDTNGYPISWSEIHEHLAGIKKAGGFKPHEMHTHIITPDMESSSRRAQEAMEVARIYREMGKPQMMVYSEGVKEDAEPVAEAPARKLIRRKPRPKT